MTHEKEEPFLLPAPTRSLYARASSNTRNNSPFLWVILYKSTTATTEDDTFNCDCIQQQNHPNYIEHHYAIEQEHRTPEHYKTQ